jgi:hypothetical protein
MRAKAIREGFEGKAIRSKRYVYIRSNTVRERERERQEGRGKVRDPLVGGVYSL